MGASGFTFSYCGCGVTSAQSGFSAYKGGAFTVIVVIRVVGEGKQRHERTWPVYRPLLLISKNTRYILDSEYPIPQQHSLHPS